jgi:hypothetical protein
MKNRTKWPHRVPILVAVSILGAKPSWGAGVKVTEANARLSLGLLAVDRARDLYNALDVVVQHIPPNCPSEDVCTPAIDLKNVSIGSIQFYCELFTDQPIEPDCFLQGMHEPRSLSFQLTDSAAQVTAAALDVVGNPYQSSDGLVTISCEADQCTVQGNAITSYWLNGSNFYFELHQYLTYGRAILKPPFFNEEARAFYDIFAVPEMDFGTYATKTLNTGGLDLRCSRFIASYYYYRYRCDWDVPVPDAPLLFPVDVTFSLDGDAATALYNGLDVPGPTREFHTSDELQIIICDPAHCDVRLRRPPID